MTIARTTMTTTPISVESITSRRSRSAAARFKSSPPSRRGFQQLDRIPVVAGAPEQPLLAARPGAEAELGKLAGSLEPQPGERRRGGGAGAGGGDRRQELVAFRRGQVLDEDRVEEDRRDSLDRLGEPLRRPGRRRRPLHRYGMRRRQLEGPPATAPAAGAGRARYRRAASVAPPRCQRRPAPHRTLRARPHRPLRGGWRISLGMREKCAIQAL